MDYFESIPVVYKDNVDPFESIPVIYCGFDPDSIMKAVAHLLPQVEVIHTISSYDQAELELPLLLAGEIPPPLPTSSTRLAMDPDNSMGPLISVSAPPNLGTGDYSRPPAAVIFSLGYTPNIHKLRKSLGLVNTLAVNRQSILPKRFGPGGVLRLGIPWLAADVANFGDAGQTGAGLLAVIRMKAMMTWIAHEGLFIGDGVFDY